MSGQSGVPATSLEMAQSWLTGWLQLAGGDNELAWFHGEPELLGAFFGCSLSSSFEADRIYPLDGLLLFSPQCKCECACLQIAIVCQP